MDLEDLIAPLVVIGIILLIVVGILALPLLLGLLYLILKSVIVSLPACIAVVGVMIGAQRLYCLRQLEQLSAQGMLRRLMTVRLKDSGWIWVLDEAAIRQQANVSKASLVSVFAGIVATLILSALLLWNGVYASNIWLFWGKTATVSPVISLVSTYLLSGLTIVMTVKKTKPLETFKKTVKNRTKTLVTEEDRLELAKANKLYDDAMSFYVATAREVNKTGSIPLIKEMEYNHAGLTSSNLKDLIPGRSWREFEDITDAIVKDLKRLREVAVKYQEASEEPEAMKETEEEKAHRILAVPPNATVEQIKRAYKTLASIWHPDAQTVKDDSRMKEINWAHDFLMERQYAS